MGQQAAGHDFRSDFPFAYDEWLKHSAGLGRVPDEHDGTNIVIIGAGIAEMIAAFELMKLGLKPILYE